MNIDKTVQIMLSREDIERLINGDGFKIGCSDWDFNYFRNKYEIVEKDDGGISSV